MAPVARVPFIRGVTAIWRAFPHPALDTGLGRRYAIHMRRIRLDVAVYQRGLASSIERAGRLILAGRVLVDGKVAHKAGAQVGEQVEIQVRSGLPYVSRGGRKLEEALRVFNICPRGWVAADVGASTGGFTDCLLQHGVARIYAIDVGYGQLAWKLRQDPRVVVMERTNARYLQSLAESVDLVTIDVSFISLRLILPQVRRWLSPRGQVIALVKPQFEADRSQVGKGGIVRDGRAHRSALCGVLEWAIENGWLLFGLIRSPIKGSKGNVEFLAWLGSDPQTPAIPLDLAIDDVVAAQE